MEPNNLIKQPLFDDFLAANVQHKCEIKHGATTPAAKSSKQNSLYSAACFCCNSINICSARCKRNNAGVVLLDNSDVLITDPPISAFIELSLRRKEKLLHFKKYSNKIYVETNKLAAFDTSAGLVSTRIQISNSLPHIRRPNGSPWIPKEIGAIIISPTRELALQISEVLQVFLTHEQLQHLRQKLIVGGGNTEEDLRSVKMNTWLVNNATRRKSQRRKNLKVNVKKRKFNHKRMTRMEDNNEEDCSSSSAEEKEDKGIANIEKVTKQKHLQHKMQIFVKNNEAKDENKSSTDDNRDDEDDEMASERFVVYETSLFVD
uniref:DEAD/DEAH box helicase domain-containing protein n=1 Tax=Glossina palpalis gambiensis TaxID=67801 RepID=A0A1B0C2M4_9MUSC